MLTNKQVEEIREHLDRAQNPLFFFDNDVDGLVSFLLLQRYLERGRGVAIKSFPGLSEAYFRKVEELRPDAIFILDKPLVDQEFIDRVEERGLPIIMIDHHDVEKANLKNYYNTFHESGLNEPTSYLCQKITNKKEDLWLAVVGCIGDGYIPDFLEDLEKQSPELVNILLDIPKEGDNLAMSRKAFQILYNTTIGKIALIFDYALKDTVTNVVNMMRYLMRVKNAYDVLEENSKTKSFLDRYKFIDNIVQKVVNKTENSIDKDTGLLFFTYGGDMSLSQLIANQLFYKYPELVIVVGYTNGNVVNFSLRGKIDVRDMTLKAIKNIEGATGGGHKNSTGAKMTSDNVSKFKENIVGYLKEL